MHWTNLATNRRYEHTKSFEKEFRQLCNLITCDLAWLSKATITTMLIMTQTIVHWTEDMNTQSRHPLAQLYGILRIALRSCYWQNHFIEYPSKTWTFTKSSSAHAVILIIVLVFILKNHFIVLVLLNRSRLIMSKTFVHWTEDIIQSRHRLAQLYIRHSSYCTPLVLLRKLFYWVLVLFTKPFMDNRGTNRR
jgi:hypothetical protein